jgi:phosphoribosylglycinamide formyltransferase-1
MSAAATPLRTAVLISGRGSNMQALVQASRTADYPAEIALIVSNRADAAGLEWAQAQGLATAVVDHQAFAMRSDFDERIGEILCESGVELVALAGFMRLMTSEFVNSWQGRMINIHPSLLPAFKGLDTHGRALAAGVKITGCTVHFVTPEVDEGPIIAQAAVPVIESDDEDRLAARVLAAEHRLYPAALRWVAEGSITFENAARAGSGSVNQDHVLMSPQAS